GAVETLDRARVQRLQRLADALRRDEVEVGRGQELRRRHPGGAELLERAVGAVGEEVGVHVVRGQQLAHALVEVLPGRLRMLYLPGGGEVLREAFQARHAQLERLQQGGLVGL